MKNLLLIILLMSNIFAITLNIDKLSQQAKKQNKSLLIFFHMDYCGYCERMLKENFKNKIILKNIENNFIYIDININDEDTIIFKGFKGNQLEFARNYRVHFFPTTIFLQDNKVIYKVKGYRNIKKFKHILKYIRTNEYKKKSLENFISEQDMM